ncbi:MAG: flavodoxin family protein [Sphaerochaetaceae bacterium]
MKVLGIIGSKRKKGNTTILVNQALKPFIENGDTCEVIHLGSLTFEGCYGCEGCAKTNKCVLKDDMQPLYTKLREADAVILGSPTYFYNMSSDMKKFIDRCYCFCTFSDDDRSQWISEFENGKPKYAGIIAVCEQNSVDDMGYTAIAMRDAWRSLGFRNVFVQGALKAFRPGEINSQPDQVEAAYKNGVRLRETVKLARKAVKD